jgi:Na+/H+-dicarboxylate symporter
MTLDLKAAARRSSIMMGFSLFAGLCAMAGAIGYFKFHQPWALAAFLVAVVVGLGSQIWFIASLRAPKSSSTGKGA